MTSEDSTVRLQNESVALDSWCYDIVLTHRLCCLPLSLPTSKACRVSEVFFFFFFGGRGEKKRLCDGEYDGAAEEADGALSQCAARMMDEL